ERLPVIALYLDHPVAQGTAAATAVLESLHESRQRGIVHVQTLDQGDALALASLGLATQSNDAIGGGSCKRGFVTLALRFRQATSGAHSAAVSGIDERGVARHYQDLYSGGRTKSCSLRALSCACR